MLPARHGRGGQAARLPTSMSGAADESRIAENTSLSESPKDAIAPLTVEGNCGYIARGADARAALSRTSRNDATRPMRALSIDSTIIVGPHRLGAAVTASGIAWTSTDRPSDQEAPPSTLDA